MIEQRDTGPVGVDYGLIVRHRQQLDFTQSGSNEVEVGIRFVHLVDDDDYAALVLFPGDCKGPGSNVEGPRGRLDDYHSHVDLRLVEPCEGADSRF